MGIIADKVGYAILRFLAPAKHYQSRGKIQVEPSTSLQQFFGADFFSLIKNKVVIDFGCGMGNLSVEMAQKGATKVIGVRAD